MSPALLAAAREKCHDRYLSNGEVIRRALAAFAGCDLTHEPDMSNGEMIRRALTAFDGCDLTHEPGTKGES